MSIALSDLITRLEEDVPARNGTPSAKQYENAIKDAVADFSRRAGRVKISSLQIVNGTASYALPADFLKMVWLESATSVDGRVLITAAGLVPIGSGTVEEWTVSNGTITFYPTPATSRTREFKYKAGWALSGESYADLGDVEAGIALLLAQSLALTKIANKLAGDAWRYAIGDESVDKTSQGQSMRNQADALAVDYREAVESYVGSQVVR